MDTQKTTIFIHGTLPPIPLLKIPKVRQFFYCPEGLVHLKELNARYHIARMAHKLCALDPDRFDSDNFYIFGWSGKLSYKARENAAQELYTKLLELNQIKSLTSLRIITHSHGGNVALYLNNLANSEPNSRQLLIDELILLACPVQLCTAGFTYNNKLFKRIYSLHSHYDMLQIIDPQGVYQFVNSCKNNGVKVTFSALNKLRPIFSQRHFNTCSHIIQARIQINNRDLMHIEFLLSHFINLFPRVLDILISHESQEIPEKEIIINLRN